jgi:aminoglycoside/choline kinase family phosphotransferase
MSAAAAAIEDEVRAVAAAALGAAVDRIDALAGGGVGHRAFFRVWLRGGGVRTAIARVDRGEPAPEVPNEPPLEPLRAFLEAAGLPVPRRLGGDTARGIDLLEDAGSTTLEDAVRADPAARRVLYEEACDGLPALQRLADPGTGLHAFARRLDAALVALKARRFVARGLPALLGRAATDAEAACVRDAFAAVVEAIDAAPQRLAHRDYQSRNLLVRPPDAAGRRLVWIDLQGALLAPPEYDAVCLLRDTYVALADDEVASLAERVRSRLPDAPDRSVFAWRFDLLTITRKCKDFTLCHELAARGDPSWLPLAPATIGYVRTAIARVADTDERLAALARLVGAPA